MSRHCKPRLHPVDSTIPQRAFYSKNFTGFAMRISHNFHHGEHSPGSGYSRSSSGRSIGWRVSLHCVAFFIAFYRRFQLLFKRYFHQKASCHPNFLASNSCWTLKTLESLRYLKISENIWNYLKTESSNKVSFQWKVILLEIAPGMTAYEIASNSIRHKFDTSNLRAFKVEESKSVLPKVFSQNGSPQWNFNVRTLSG